jgi:GTP cyclohydrolase I
MSSEPNAPVPDEGTPVSVKIRERLNAARKRFHANDNIAEFIQPGELEQLLDEVESKMQGVLDAMVIDTAGDHNTRSTARRVAKMYLNEVFKGRYVQPPTITEFPNAEHLNELMIVGPITVRSACSHHFCPVIGKIWIGILPNEHTNVIGLSKYARLVDWVMGRPQIQEEAVVQLADLIMEKTQPDGLAVVMEASHFCMSWRGVQLRDARRVPQGPGAATRISLTHTRKEWMMLVRLLYVSRAVDTSPAAIEAILAEGREHNPACGITGVLCYGGGIFLQAIEGGRSAVSRLYASIQKDVRHKDVELLHFEEIDERRFSGWSMGQVNLAKLNHSIVLKYSERPELDPYAVSGRVSFALLEELMATASIIGRA